MTEQKRTARPFRVGDIVLHGADRVRYRVDGVSHDGLWVSVHRIRKDGEPDKRSRSGGGGSWAADFVLEEPQPSKESDR